MIDSKWFGLIGSLMFLGGMFEASIPPDGFKWYVLGFLSIIAMEIAKLREKGK